MFDRAHYLLTLGGTLLSGTEIWQTGIRFAPPVGTPPGVLEGALDHISVEDIFNDFSPIITNQVTGMQYSYKIVMTFAKLVVLDRDGHYAAAPKVHEGNAPGFLATASSSPPQLAMVASLGTGKKFGKAQRGRMYWPMPTQFVGSLDNVTGQISISLANALRDRIKTAIDNAEGEVSTVEASCFAAVMSSIGQGTTNPITTVAVGTAVDTMRRRRSNVKETYEPTPTAFGTRLAAEDPRRATFAELTLESSSQDLPGPDAG